jgi:hypothetical protein
MPFALRVLPMPASLKDNLRYMEEVGMIKDLKFFHGSFYCSIPKPDYEFGNNTTIIESNKDTTNATNSKCIKSLESISYSKLCELFEVHKQSDYTEEMVGRKE